MEPAVIRYRPVPGGPRAYRTALRTLGPFAGLLVPAVLGLLALVLRQGAASAARGVGSLVLSILAAPGLLVAGVPLRSGAGVVLAAVVGSALLWMLLGAIAAYTATRRPAATWRDFWRDYLWMAAGVWFGVLLALLAVNLILGRPAI